MLFGWCNFVEWLMLVLTTLQLVSNRQLLIIWRTLRFMKSSENDSNSNEISSTFSLLTVILLSIFTKFPPFNRKGHRIEAHFRWTETDRVENASIETMPFGRNHHVNSIICMATLRLRRSQRKWEIIFRNCDRKKMDVKKIHQEKKISWKNDTFLLLCASFELKRVEASSKKSFWEFRSFRTDVNWKMHAFAVGLINQSLASAFPLGNYNVVTHSLSKWNYTDFNYNSIAIRWNRQRHFTEQKGIVLARVGKKCTSQREHRIICSHSEAHNAHRNFHHR